LNRRELLVLGSTAIAWPLAAFAQQKAKQHRIAVIAAVLPVFRITETEGGTPWRAFFGELRRLGYVEDGNLIVERYSAEGQPERAAELAQHVVSRNPDLIVTGTGFLARAVAAATDTIPIVSSLPEAWRQGIVDSLARPGRNLTGVSTDAGIAIWGKRLQILKEAVPSASRIAYLALRDSWDGPEGQELRDASRKLGISLVGTPLSESTRSAYQDGFAEIQQHAPDAMIVSAAGGAWAHRQLIVELAEKNRLPAIHPYREWVELGGLMAYATDLADVWHRIADYVDQILNGANPADIPIYQPTKFELVINLKAANALGLTVPQTLLARADEVIE
jgi:putative tryptophan/tyrosine transport system substrate-binding protein